MVSLSRLTLTLLTLSGSANAADQPILGRSLVISDPVSGNPARRKIVLRGLERDGGQTLSGDPTVPPNSQAAVLHLRAQGTTPSAQTFVLGPGTRTDGKPFWTLEADQIAYADPAGEQGAVTTLQLRRRTNGTFQLRVSMRGTNGPIDVVPPAGGTEVTLTLTLGQGDRYCVRFGADGPVRRDTARRYAVAKMPAAACPASVTGEVLVLNYNVAGLPEGLSSSNPSVNTPLIAPLLDGYDVVLLQESWKTPDPNPFAPTRVFHEILEAGASHPFKSLSAPLPLGANPNRPSALLSDGLNTFSRYPFGEITRVAWDGCDNSAADCLALKGFSMVPMTLAPGVVVHVYDLHMEAGGNANDEALRDAGITQLSNFIQANSVGVPVIVGGDFNLHTDEEPDATQYARLLAETGMSDVCDTVGCPHPATIEKTAFRSSATVTLTPLTWSFEDAVFIRSDSEPLSDHPAQATRFEWTVVP